jgi:hypothetical protein
LFFVFQFKNSNSVSTEKHFTFRGPAPSFHSITACKENGNIIHTNVVFFKKKSHGNSQIKDTEMSKQSFVKRPVPAENKRNNKTAKFEGGK